MGRTIRSTWTLHLIDAKPSAGSGFGAEVSSTDGAMLSGFWMHRNLFGGAERLRIDGRGQSSIDGATGGNRLGAARRFPPPRHLLTRT